MVDIISRDPITTTFQFATDFTDSHVHLCFLRSFFSLIKRHERRNITVNSYKYFFLLTVKFLLFTYRYIKESFLIKIYKKNLTSNFLTLIFSN